MPLPPPWNIMAPSLPIFYLRLQRQYWPVYSEAVLASVCSSYRMAQPNWIPAGQGMYSRWNQPRFPKPCMQAPRSPA